MSQTAASRPDPKIVKAQAALYSIGDGVITTDTEGRIEILNPVAEALTGWSQEEARGRRLPEIFRIVDERAGKPCEDPVSRVLRAARTAGLAEHTVLTGRDGSEHAIEANAAPIRDDTGQILGVVLVFRNVTERRRLDHRMLHRATHDSLTDLVNRAEFEKRLDHAIGAFHLHGTPCALCYLDLDRFKVINDTAGHAAGDEMLRQMAALLKTRVRSRDTLARLGGDEFGLLLENCPAFKAFEIAEDLVATVRDFRFTWHDTRFAIGVSVGVAPVTLDVNERRELLSRADSACYIAKDLGRDRVYLYPPGGPETSPYHQGIFGAADLRGALEKKMFRLYVEPICAASDPAGGTHRYEISIRLPDIDGKLLSPASFIPAAERSGLMMELDRWVIREALRQFGNFTVGPAVPGIAINLSAGSLDDDRLVGFVRESLASSGVLAGHVCFELTETTAFNRLALAEHLIKELRRLGCRVAVDDVGSRLCSFRHLKHLPVDYLKVDGNLVRDAAGNDVDRALVRAINEIGHNMGIATVAESVETEQSLAMVRHMGIDFVQGRAIGLPRPLESLRSGQTDQKPS